MTFLLMPPPDIYNYTGAYSVWSKPAAIMQKACGTDRHDVVGCSFTVGENCYIVLDDTLNAHNYKRVLKHELAHCAGWPGDHPNAHKELFYPTQVIK